MENFIQLKKDNIVRIGIKDAEGNELKEHLEFDLEDINLPLRLNKMDVEHQKNINTLKLQIASLEKKEDKKGKYLLSWKEEEGVRILKEFYEKEMDALDLFIGKGMTKVLLNGREPYLNMYDDIAEILQPILPLLEQNANNIIDSVKKKYSTRKNEGELKA